MFLSASDSTNSKGHKEKLVNKISQLQKEKFRGDISTWARATWVSNGAKHAYPPGSMSTKEGPLIPGMIGSSWPLKLLLMSVLMSRFRVVCGREARFGQRSVTTVRAVFLC